MAVPLTGTKPKYGPTAGPWMPQGSKKPAVFQGGNADWWRGLITGQTNAAGNPRQIAEQSPIWQNYASGLRAFAQGGGGAAQQQLRNPYRDMISGDWEVQGLESEMNARMGRARGDFTQQIRQALIDLGVTDKSKLGNLGQYIDADTISNAAANKYSQTARIAQEEMSKRAQVEASLAARGMLSSGQLTKSTEDVVAGAENARYGALRDFLGAGGQGLMNLADLNDQYAGQLAQARFAAAARAADLYNSALMWDYENQQGQYAPTPGTAAAYTPFKAGLGWGAEVGQTGADRYGYSPTRPNRPGQPGFRPF